jgi:Polyketide cyclase / dehydrase and lipid transport
MRRSPGTSRVAGAGRGARAGGAAPALRAGAYHHRMSVDVTTEIEIDRRRAEVAHFASDPDNAVAWYENITAVEWRTPRPVAIGSRIEFHARFLGRRLAYTYEVTEVLAGERFVMSTAEGPFPMETTYTWQDTPSGGTRMTLRNRGGQSGFPGLASPLMAVAMRRANRQDLGRLKSVLEASAGSPWDGPAITTAPSHPTVTDPAGGAPAGP